MPTVKITIEGATPLEALAHVTAFGLRCYTDTDIRQAADHIREAEERKAAKDRAESAQEPAPAAVPAPAPAEDPTPTEETSSAESGRTAPPTEGPVPTVEAVREKGIAAAQAYGKETIRGILNSFGVGSMTELAAGDRAGFLAKLEELGDKSA